MRARIRETEWFPVLYLDTDGLDQPAPGYTEGPPVYEVPDDLVARFEAAKARYLEAEDELYAWLQEQQT